MRKFWIFILVICIIAIVGTVTYIYWDDITTYVNSVLNPEEENREYNYSCDTLEIHYIELPSIGDSTLIKCGDYDIIVDAGDRDSESINALKTYLAKNIKDGKIEMLIATHSDADHIGGLFGEKVQGILFDYEFDFIIDYGFLHSTNIATNYATKRDEFVANGTKHCAGYDFVNKVEGCEFKNYIAPNLQLNILDTSDYMVKHTNPNDNSISFEIVHYNNKYLFTGDLLAKGERKLVANGIGKYDVFHAGHHGAASANSQAFLDAIQPKDIILSYSMGGNSYGIPQQEALNRMYSKTHTIYSTYTNGNIVLKSDSNGYKYEFSTNDLLFHNSDWFKLNREFPGNYIM